MTLLKPKENHVIQPDKQLNDAMLKTEEPFLARKVICIVKPFRTETASIFLPSHMKILWSFSYLVLSIICFGFGNFYFISEKTAHLKYHICHGFQNTIYSTYAFKSTISHCLTGYIFHLESLAYIWCSFFFLSALKKGVGSMSNQKKHANMLCISVNHPIPWKATRCQVLEQG